jgi:hypothetical protein
MTPTPELAPPPAAPPPTYKLHSPENVAIAAFLGSPIAGAWLMALNERRVGNRKGYTRYAALGFLFTVVVLAIGVGLGIAMPKAPSYGLPIAYVIGMRSWAQSAQGKMLEAHLAAKGLKASAGGALLSGIICLVLILVGMVGVLAVGPDSLSDRYEAAHEQYIEYDDGATRADAMKAGEAMKAAGVLTGSHPMDMKLARTGKRGFALSFVVNAENAAKQDMQDGFSDVGEKVTAALSEPVEVRLCQDDWTPRVTLKAPSATP